MVQFLIALFLLKKKKNTLSWCCRMGIFEYTCVSDTHSILSPFNPFPLLFCPPLEVCGKCGEALSRTQPAVRAMNKLFHSNCFCCMSCHRPLQGMQFYDRDGSPECEDCYMVRRHVQIASEMSELNTTFQFISALPRPVWSRRCFSSFSEFPGSLFQMWGEDHRPGAEGSGPVFPC